MTEGRPRRVRDLPMQLIQGESSFGQMPAPSLLLGREMETEERLWKWLLTLSCVILGKSTPSSSSQFSSL